MKGRLVIAGLFLVAAAALGFAADDRAKDAKGSPHGALSQCCRACADCMQQCESCAAHCVRLVSDGKTEHLRTMALCADCGDVCALAAKLTARHGPLVVTVCEACAKACDQCAAACEKHPGDKHMRACAESCRDCAKACREMVKDLGKAGARE
jgi:hypothetical protein